MNVAEVTFTRKFCAAHRIASDPGVCSRIHGHNYVAEITVKRIALGDRSALSSEGFVVPADKIKDLVDKKYDHRLILDESDSLMVGRHRDTWHSKNNLEGTLLKNVEAEGWIVRVPGPPSTENMAQWIANDVAELMRHAKGSTCQVYVKLFETDTIQAWATA